METIRKVEYGGYLPLELNNGNEYFVEYDQFTNRFNSVKASFAYIIKKKNINILFIPYYYCPSTIAAIKTMGVDVRFYHIDKDFCPLDIEDKAGQAILLVDYFGICDSVVNRIQNNFEQSQIIIDRAHNFFASPILREGVYNVYSAKKFFGVPDGSYLISKEFEREEERFSYSHLYASYLIEAYEKGTNFAYAKKKKADELIAQHYDKMSVLAHGILKNIDYDAVKKTRQSNYGLLRNKLSIYNELKLPERCAAYQFPLLIKENGTQVKKELVQQKIYVSTLWTGEELLSCGTLFELHMKDDCIFLPVDQRYNEVDMEYICDSVINIVRENVIYENS